MTPHEFITKWRNGGDERRDAQPFFEELCRLVGHPTPREADPNHTWFTYEYGATKASGGQGWADVWKKDFFGWEAKGTNRSLDKAYQQLKMYADALQNPPLLVVSDLQTIIVHSNFTNTVKREFRFTVDQLADYEIRKILENVFYNPQALRPEITRTAITTEAAEKFTDLAVALRERGHAPQAVAHFLNRLLFCMFAEDIGLLPNNVFTKLVASSLDKPDLFEARSSELFRAMNTGGDVFLENIEWFNGGLFNDDQTLRLEVDEIKLLLDAAKLDWSEIDPSIFGTLFERGLDPEKRSQIGAFYTDPETIMKIVRPVIIEPWLAEWESERLALAEILSKSKIKGIPKAVQDRFNYFLERLRSFTVLDPACGSGNFLYLSLRALKDVEHRVLSEAEMLGLGRQFPAVGPANVKGIELNAYAAELARITVWIGEIQWMIQNGYRANREPILKPLDQIENRDALVNDDGTEAVWPVADAIVGNPPFLGDKKMINELGEAYTNTLRAAYSGRVPGGADFVCYWFEKANDAIKAGFTKRVGLVSTNAIRGGKNREVLKHITETSRIFSAWSDEEWVNDGAAVRVSLTSFGHWDGSPVLDGVTVGQIYADLTADGADGLGVDLTKAVYDKSNANISFIGTQKSGPFELSGNIARTWLSLPNPHGRSNAEVVKPWANGLDLVRRPTDTWVIDYGAKMDESAAALYEIPFSYLKKSFDEANVRQSKSTSNVWWRHERPRPDMRAALLGLKRYIGTARVAKYRVFSWLSVATVPDCQIVVIARDDDASMGILSSRFHEVWALRMGTNLGSTPRYTPSSTFETFPFPEGLTPDKSASAYSDDPRAKRIAEASQALVAARDCWLNPAEWVDWVITPEEEKAGFPMRPVAKPGHEADLKKRTLTNLYNTRPAWLNNLHRDLDVAVAAAYGWEWPLTDDEILCRLFALNQARTS